MAASARFRATCVLTCSLAVLLLGSCSSTTEEEDNDELDTRTYAITCGVERWSVKTGTDADKNLVNLTPSSTTISSLRGLTKPASLPDNNRTTNEKQVVKLTNITLVEYKLETDSDIHMVLKDSSGNTMIGEIPAGGCVGSGSVFASGIQSARTAFDAKYTATTSFKTVNATISVIGERFFDFAHNQTGAAPNQIELHPVTGICWGTNCTIGGGGGGGGACAHAICTAGTKLTSGCDPCVTQICAADSYCCNTSWSSVCVNEVASICGQTCGGSSCAHAICTTGSKLTSGCDPCVTQICAADSYCCNNQWDAQCKGEVTSICGQSCP